MLVAFGPMDLKTCALCLGRGVHLAFSLFENALQCLIVWRGRSEGQEVFDSPQLSFIFCDADTGSHMVLQHAPCFVWQQIPALGVHNPSDSWCILRHRSNF